MNDTVFQYPLRQKNDQRSVLDLIAYDHAGQLRYADTSQGRRAKCNHVISHEARIVPDSGTRSFTTAKFPDVVTLLRLHIHGGKPMQIRRQRRRTPLAQ